MLLGNTSLLIAPCEQAEGQQAIPNAAAQDKDSGVSGITLLCRQAEGKGNLCHFVV